MTMSGIHIGAVQGFNKALRVRAISSGTVSRLVVAPCDCCASLTFTCSCVCVWHRHRFHGPLMCIVQEYAHEYRPRSAGAGHAVASRGVWIAAACHLERYSAAPADWLVGWLVGLMVGACRFASRAVRRYAGSEVKCDLSCGRHTATPHSNSVPVVAFGAIVVVLAAAVC